MGVHGQLALDEVAAGAVAFVEPVEAVQLDAVSVEVDELAAVDACVDFTVDDFAAAVVAVVVAVVPVAMQAPRTAVARTLAAPAATRERAAGRRRPDRLGIGVLVCFAHGTHHPDRR